MDDEMSTDDLVDHTSGPELELELEIILIALMNLWDKVNGNQSFSQVKLCDL